MRDKQLAKQFLTKHSKCCNCGEDATEAHHIIPLALGGKDIESNLCPLCLNCHNLLHEATNNKGQISRSKLIKAGQAASDKKSGRPQGKLDKMTKDLKEDIINYINSLNGDISVLRNSKPLIEKHNLSRNTFKKYVRLIKEEVG